MGYFTAPKIAFGPGAIEQLTGLDAHRVLLVADPAARAQDLDRRVLEELAKVDASVETFDGVARGPALAAVESGVARARALRPDTIVALGGGTTIETAKGIWVGLARPDQGWETVTPLSELRLRDVARFVAIPTTGGSGSESTWTVRLRRPDAAPPVELSSRELVADWALLDPSFSRTLPPRATADAGAEAIGLAIESLASEWSTPFSEVFARSALAGALPALPKAVRHPDDLEARSALLGAATMAGVAAANAQVGVGQALAQSITDELDVSYGRVLAALLPYVTEFNYPSARERYATLAPFLGGAVAQHRSSLAERLRVAWDGAQLPRTLADAGVDSSALSDRRETIAERAASTPAALGNPRVASREELVRLLEVALAGGPVTF